MATTAHYRMIDDAELAELVPDPADDLPTGSVWDPADTTDRAVDVGVWWDMLHLAYTGVSTSEPIEHPLSEAVLGVESLEDDTDDTADTEDTAGSAASAAGSAASADGPEHEQLLASDGGCENCSCGGHEAEEFVGLSHTLELEHIVRALEQVDLPAALVGLQVTPQLQEEIYPEGALDLAPIALLSELEQAHTALTDFYRRAAAAGRHVVVTIG